MEEANFFYAILLRHPHLQQVFCGWLREHWVQQREWKLAAQPEMSFQGDGQSRWGTGTRARSPILEGTGSVVPRFDSSLE